MKNTHTTRNKVLSGGSGDGGGGLGVGEGEGIPLPELVNMIGFQNRATLRNVLTLNIDVQ